MYHMTEYCPLIGTAVEYSVHQTLPSMRKWAGSRDYSGSRIN